MWRLAAVVLSPPGHLRERHDRSTRLGRVRGARDEVQDLREDRSAASRDPSDGALAGRFAGLGLRDGALPGRLARDASQECPKVLVDDSRLFQRGEVRRVWDHPYTRPRDSPADLDRARRRRRPVLVSNKNEGGASDGWQVALPAKAGDKIPNGPVDLWVGRKESLSRSIHQIRTAADRLSGEPGRHQLVGNSSHAGRTRALGTGACRSLSLWRQAARRTQQAQRRDLRRMRDRERLGEHAAEGDPDEVDP